MAKDEPMQPVPATAIFMLVIPFWFILSLFDFLFFC